MRWHCFSVFSSQARHWARIRESPMKRGERARESQVAEGRHRHLRLLGQCVGDNRLLEGVPVVEK
jgi:hypothetical protein